MAEIGLADPAGGRRGEGHRAGAQAVQALPAERLRRLEGRVLLRLRAQDHPQRQGLRRRADRPRPSCCCAAGSPSPRRSTRTRSARAGVAGRPRRTRRDEVASALVSVQPGTGQVRAMAVSRDYGDKNKRARSSSTRPPTGRTAAAAASRPGRRSSRSSRPRPWRRASRSATRSTRRTRLSIGDVQGCNETLTDEWEPFNETTSENGTYTLQTGIEGSINTYFAQLEERVGVCRPKQIAEALGVAARRRQAAAGGQVVHPRRRRGVAAVDGRGLRVLRRPRRALQLDRDPRGDRPVRQPPPGAPGRLQAGHRPGHRRRRQRAAAGRHRARHRRPGRDRPPGAGKTGTTNRRVSVWFVGYTPDLATAVWVGNPSPPPERLPAAEPADRRRLLRRRLRRLPAGPDLAADDERHAGRHPGVVVHRRRRRRPAGRRRSRCRR